MTEAAHRCVIALLIVVSMAAAADAQTDNHIAIGAEWTERLSQGPGSHGDQGIGFTWRFGQSTEGWGWSYGLGWYSTDIDRAVAGRTVEWGELKVRPFMAGYGYTHVMRRSALTAELMGGYAFTAFDLKPAAIDAYVAGLGARSLSADVGNVLVVRPQLGFWYDVNRRIGVHVGAAYVIARPKIVVSSTIGDDAVRYKADSFTLKIGAVYSIF
jgi:hypothetical protein